MSMKVCNLDNILKYHCTLDKNVDFYAVPHSKCILETGRVFTAQVTREAPSLYEVKVKVAQSSLILCDPTGYTAHEIL